jgi:hypothetical protein
MSPNSKKAWYKSKIIWFNAAMAILAISQLLYKMDQFAGALLICALANLCLRMTLDKKSGLQ